MPFDLFLPVIKLCLVAIAAKIGGLLLHVALSIGNSLVVDARPNFSHAEFEKERRFEVTDLRLHVLGDESLDRYEEILLGVLLEFDRHGRASKLRRPPHYAQRTMSAAA